MSSKQHGINYCTFNLYPNRWLCQT